MAISTPAQKPRGAARSTLSTAMVCRLRPGIRRYGRRSMDPNRLGADDVARLAREVLGSDLSTIDRHPVGFSNDSWQVTDTTGRSFVVKVAGLEFEPKWRSSSLAYRLAGDAGLPVPELVHFGAFDDH